MFVPTLAWAKVKAAVPASVTSSPVWTSERPMLPGGVTCWVASVVASYCRFATEKEPVIVSGLREMSAVPFADAVTDGSA